jgi:hypothetical protein
MLSEPVPVAALVENFSPMPRTAPLPFGREMVGKSGAPLDIVADPVNGCAAGATADRADATTVGELRSSVICLLLVVSSAAGADGMR